MSASFNFYPKDLAWLLDSDRIRLGTTLDATLPSSITSAQELENLCTIVPFSAQFL